MSERPKIKHSAEVRKDIFQDQMGRLGLTDAEMMSIESICDVGSGANDFIAEVKKRYPHIFGLGIEAREDAYALEDMHSINHSAINIGIPDSAPRFDIVTSYEAIPKYFHRFSIPGTSELYDYSALEDVPKDERGAFEAELQAISEMLRITKRNGKVLMYPVLTLSHRPLSPSNWKTPGFHATQHEAVLYNLKRLHPGLSIKYMIDEIETNKAREFHKKNVFVCRVEILNKSR